MAAAATRRQAQQAMMTARVTVCAVAAAMAKENAKCLDKLNADLLRQIEEAR